MVYRYAAGRAESAPTTLVEFPAYEDRLEEVCRAVEAFGFDPDSVRVTGMLDDIHAAGIEEPAPAGAPYVARLRVKHRAMVA